MKYIAAKTLILSALFVIFAALFASAQTFTTFSNLSYVNDGNVRHRLDLYVPNGVSGPIPLIVWIHGGGWVGGDKTLNPNGHQLRYARNGYAVASINYRLSGEAIFPAQIHDVKSAIRWLRANAGQYNLDPTRFGVWGSSAGGHLAALAGTSNDVTELEGNVGGNLQFSSRVQAVLDWYGPTDFLQMDAQGAAQGCGPGNHNSATSAESMLVGCPIQTCPQTVQRANPMTYLTSDDPPFFIEHGTVDCTVPTGQSQIFQTLLQSRGHDSRLTLLTGAGHGGPLFSAEPNMLEVDAFWNEKLRLSVNPLIGSARIFYKNAEVTYFRAGSLASLYRIVVTGSNIQTGTTAIVNGAARGAVLNGNELTINGLPGRIPADGEFTIQLRNAGGSHSNVSRVAVAGGQ